MTVSVLLFGPLREAVGEGVLALELPQGASGQELLDRLIETHGSVRAYRPYVRLAVNTVYADSSIVLRDGDEVALITPTSGG